MMRFHVSCIYGYGIAHRGNLAFNGNAFAIGVSVLSAGEGWMCVYSILDTTCRSNFASLLEACVALRRRIGCDRTVIESPF